MPEVNLPPSSAGQPEKPDEPIFVQPISRPEEPLPADKGYQTMGVSTAPATAESGTTTEIVSSAIPKLPAPKITKKFTTEEAKFVEKLRQVDVKADAKEFINTVLSEGKIQGAREGLIHTAFDAVYNETFDRLVEKEKTQPTLPKPADPQAKPISERLMASHLNPESKSLLTPEEKKLQATIEKESLKEAREAVPEAGDRQPEVNLEERAKFNGEIKTEYQTKLHEAIEQFIKENPKLNPEEIKNLRLLVMDPEAQLPKGMEKIVESFQKVQSQVMQTIQNRTGVSLQEIKTFLTTTQYTAFLNGFFIEFLSQELKGQPLKTSFSTKEAASIKRALKKPYDSSALEGVSPEMKAYILAMQKAKDKLSGMFEVSDVWIPDLSAKYPQMNPLLKGAFSYIEDNLDLLAKYLDKGIGPAEISSKGAATEFLKKGLSAGAALKAKGEGAGSPEEIQEGDWQKAMNMVLLNVRKESQRMGFVKSDLMNENIKEQRTASLAQLEEERKQQAEMAKQKQKAESTSLAMKILGPILLVVGLVISILTANPVAIVLAVAMFVLTVTDYALQAAGKSPLFQMIFKAIDEAIDKDSNLDAKNEWKLAIKSVVAAVLATVAVVGAIFGGAAALGPLVGIFLNAFTSSKMLDLIFTMTNASEDVKKWGSIFIPLALAVIGMGATLAVAIAEASKQAVQTVKTVLQRILEQLREKLKNLTIALQVSKQVGEVAEKSVNASTGFIRANIAKIQGLLDEMSALGEGDEEALRVYKEESLKYMQECQEFASKNIRLIQQMSDKQARTVSQMFNLSSDV